VCLAHTENDQVETVLQRFFQGASGTSLGGIKQTRGIYCRPLLSISRTQIETYLELLGVSWMTDETNRELTYLRNRYRQILVPVLNEYFPGWTTGMLSAAQRAFEDGSVLDTMAAGTDWITEQRYPDGTVQSVSIPVEEFSVQPVPIRIRMLYRALAQLGFSDRFPRAILSAFCSGSAAVEGGGIRIEQTSTMIRVKYRNVYSKTAAFFAIIEKTGMYTFPFGLVQVESFSGCVDRPNCIGPFSLPLCIRSRRSPDTVRTSGGQLKTIKKLFSDWHIPEQKRDMLPVIEELLETTSVHSPVGRDSVNPVCVWGYPAGYKNWYAAIPDQPVNTGRIVYLVFLENMI
jgi:tRNA(Ile)-lysidine synthase